jgi:type II secretory ATPase GspE/PulE/Tfp pilus assembly ATPase PilB-like protein
MRDGSDEPGPGRPKDAPDEKVHWLVRIAERAGLEGFERPRVAPGARALDVWAAVAKAYGLSDDRLAGLVADYFHLGPADIDAASPNAALLVSESTARRLHVFPLFESDRHLMVATCDPTDVEAERTLGFSTGRHVIFAVAPPGAIQIAIDRRFPPEPAEEAPAALEGGDELVRVVDGLGPETITEDDAVATPVIELTNVIIRDAVAAGAAEILVEPGPRLGTVRFRVDGVLRGHMDLPLAATSRVISRFKELCRLDVVDHVRPQEGTARVRVHERWYELGVSTMSTHGVERCTVHVRAPGITLTLDDLGIPSPELERLRGLLGHRDGIVVFAGPEGSGKTTTLCAALRELAGGTVHVMSVEDPVECMVEGVAHVRVDAMRGGTMTSAIESALRKDPDVLSVGEILDQETALAVARATARGRLVLSTLRADDAVAAVGHPRPDPAWGGRPTPAEEGVPPLRRARPRPPHTGRVAAHRAPWDRAPRAGRGLPRLRVHGLPGQGAGHGGDGGGPEGQTGRRAGRRMGGGAPGRCPGWHEDLARRGCRVGREGQDHPGGSGGPRGERHTPVGERAGASLDPQPPMRPGRVHG